MKNESKASIKTYVCYMFPSLLDLSVYSLLTAFNGMFTSRILGESAMAAVNLASPYVSIIYSYALLFGVGGSTMISICRGRGEQEKADRYFSQTVAVLFASTVLIGVVSFFLTHKLALILGATPENLALVVSYLRTITLCSLTFAACYMLAVMVKADGHPELCIYGCLSGALTNVLLLFLLVRKLRMGMTGVALATAGGQGTIAVLYLSHFFTKSATLRLRPFRFDRSLQISTIKLGISDAISEGSSGIFVFVFNHIILSLMGEPGIVIFSVINYMNLLSVQMSLGITQGMQPLVSYMHGGENHRAASDYFRYARIFAIGLGALLFVVCCFCGPVLVRQFISPENGQLFASGVSALKRFSPFFLFIGFNVSSIGYFSATERPRTAQFLSQFRSISGMVLFGLVCAKVMGERGVWLAPALTEAVCAVFALFFFLHPRSRKAVRSRPE